MAKRRTLWTVFLSVVMLALLPSCSRPVSDEYFVRTQKADSEWRYSFEVDLSGEQAFDLDIYVNMDCGNHRFAEFTGLKLFMLWESPEGEKYYEDIFLGRDCLDKGNYFTKRIAAPYRSGLSMDPPGVWKLSAQPSEEDIERFGITGIGIRVTRVE